MNDKPMENEKKSQSTLAGVIGQTRRRAREGHLSVPRQLIEMAVLKLVYGLGPGHYHTARYWRKGLPWRFKTGFWPYARYRRFVATLNPPVYQKLSQNKISEKALLQLLNIPSPRFVGRLHSRYGVSFAGGPLTSAGDLQQLLLANPGLDRLCFKLVEGYGGRGFQAIQCIRDGELTVELLDTGRRLSVPDFLSGVLDIGAGTDYLIEEYITQHPQLASLNPSSVNTLRVFAYCKDGETAVMDAFLRVGRRGSLVDNTSRGAQIFRLDRQSGVIGQGLGKDIFNEVFENHKDSGERITGRNLPFWHESLELAQRTVAVFPNIMFAGLDIAITAGGPVVIEMNVEPDPTAAITFDRSHAEIFACLK